MFMNSHVTMNYPSYTINILFFLGWLQFHRQEEVFSSTDGSLYLSLPGEDGLSLQQGNETNC